jgi:hypothetical protein
VFGALARARCPVFWVPGPGDVPVERYLQEAFNIETAFPLLRGVHGTAAAASRGVLFAGFGEEGSDDPRQPHDERQKLSYPRWEAEYRLKVLREFDYDELVLLTWTAPAHKGQQRAGSEAVAELIAPGSLRDGHHAVADLRERTAVLKELTAAPASAGG